MWLLLTLPLIRHVPVQDARVRRILGEEQPQRQHVAQWKPEVQLTEVLVLLHE